MPSALLRVRVMKERDEPLRKSGSEQPCGTAVRPILKGESARKRGQVKSLEKYTRGAIHVEEDAERKETREKKKKKRFNWGP